MDYQELIKREESAIALLLAKVEERQQRIAALKTLASTDDEIDDALDRTVANRAASKSVENQMLAAPLWVPTLPKAVSTEGGLNSLGMSRNNGLKFDPSNSFRSVTMAFNNELLEFIGAGKSLAEVSVFFSAKGRKLGNTDDPYATVRTYLWNLKTKTGLLENPAKGFYVSKRHKSDLKKDESPVSAGLPGI